MQELAAKSDFIGLTGTVNLVSGGEPPLLQAHRQAFEAYAKDKARGYAGYWNHWAVNDEVRALLADMLSLDTGDIALTGSASEGISQVVSSIDWQAGDNAVTTQTEYASGRFAFSGLAKYGVEARMVAAQGWEIDARQLVDACDEKTRLVYLSQVSYKTGQQLDMAYLSAELATRNIPLLNDASHALGVTPVDGRLADFVVCSGYKWILGTQTGIFAWNRKRRPAFEPRGIGWRSATQLDQKGEITRRADANRVQVGNANHLDVYLLRESVKYIQRFGVDSIRGHVLALGDTLLTALDNLGIEIITPRSRDERAGNICFLHPAAEKMVELAAAENILFWGDEGRIRVSIHLFNDGSDIDTLIRFLTINRSRLK